MGVVRLPALPAAPIPALPAVPILGGVHRGTMNDGAVPDQRGTVEQYQTSEDRRSSIEPASIGGAAIGGAARR
jgi:hypothetical protein